MSNIRYGPRSKESIRNRELEATGRETWSDSLEAVYETDPDVIAAVLPPPLKPGPEPLVRLNISTVTMPGDLIFGAGWFGVQACHDDVLGEYPLLMPMTTEQATVGGRETFGEPKKIAEIIDVVEEIDVPAIQIMLETRLIEVAVDAEEQLGIDWSKLSKYTTILAETGEENTSGGGSVLPEDQTLGELPATALFNRLSNKKDKTKLYPKFLSRQLTAFDFTLNLLVKDNKAEVLANSRLTTINGREANIKLVDIVPYILSSGGVGGQVQVQREEVGIKLNILPTVNTDGFITVKVEPEVSTIFEFIGPDNNIPRVKSRTSSTTIRVKDGESIIIGGLLSNDKKRTEYKFPLLHKIPYFGEKVFTSNNLIERKTDLIVQITPKIVVDAYTGITKTEDMIEYEKNVMESKKSISTGE